MLTDAVVNAVCEVYNDVYGDTTLSGFQNTTMRDVSNGWNRHDARPNLAAVNVLNTGSLHWFTTGQTKVPIWDRVAAGEHSEPPDEPTVRHFALDSYRAGDSVLSLPEEVQWDICQLYGKPSDASLSVAYPKTHQQHGGVHCGGYALAFMWAYCEGHYITDIANMVFDQSTLYATVWATLCTGQVVPFEYRTDQLGEEDDGSGADSPSRNCVSSLVRSELKGVPARRQSRARSRVARSKKTTSLKRARSASSALDGKLRGTPVPSLRSKSKRRKTKRISDSDDDNSVDLGAQVGDVTEISDADQPPMKIKLPVTTGRRTRRGRRRKNKAGASEPPSLPSFDWFDGLSDDDGPPSPARENSSNQLQDESSFERAVGYAIDVSTAEHRLRAAQQNYRQQDARVADFQAMPVFGLSADAADRDPSEEPDPVVGGLRRAKHGRAAAHTGVEDAILELQAVESPPGDIGGSQNRILKKSRRGARPQSQQSTKAASGVDEMETDSVGREDERSPAARGRKRLRNLAVAKAPMEVSLKSKKARVDAGVFDAAADINDAAAQSPEDNNDASIDAALGDPYVCPGCALVMSRSGSHLCSVCANPCHVFCFSIKPTNEGFGDGGGTCPQCFSATQQLPLMPPVPATASLMDPEFELEVCARDGNSRRSSQSSVEEDDTTCEVRKLQLDKGSVVSIYAGALSEEPFFLGRVIADPSTSELEGDHVDIHWMELNKRANKYELMDIDSPGAWEPVARESFLADGLELVEGRLKPFDAELVKEVVLGGVTKKDASPDGYDLVSRESFESLLDQKHSGNMAKALRSIKHILLHSWVTGYTYGRIDTCSGITVEGRAGVTVGIRYPVDPNDPTQTKHGPRQWKKYWFLGLDANLFIHSYNAPSLSKARPGWVLLAKTKKQK
jgi:hypothetical protein